jgi:hypothetical protein
MRPFKPPTPALARATSLRMLPAFAPGIDDPAEAIFTRALVHIRDRVPSLAHHPLYDLEILFGDLRVEIAEIADSLD